MDVRPNGSPPRPLTAGYVVRRPTFPSGGTPLGGRSSLLVDSEKSRRKEPIPLQGVPPGSAELLLAHVPELWRACRKLLPRKQRGQRAMLVELAALGARYGSVFPSARHVAAAAGASRRSFWRLIGWLEGQNLVMRSRGERLNGSQSSNDYLVGPLLRRLAELIRAMLERLRWGTPDPMESWEEFNARNRGVPFRHDTVSEKARNRFINWVNQYHAGLPHAE